MVQPRIPDFFQQIDDLARRITGDRFRLKKDDPEAPMKFTSFLDESAGEFEEATGQPATFTEFEQNGFELPQPAVAQPEPSFAEPPVPSPSVFDQTLGRAAGAVGRGALGAGRFVGDAFEQQAFGIGGAQAEFFSEHVGGKTPFDIAFTEARDSGLSMTDAFEVAREFQKNIPIGDEVTGRHGVSGFLSGLGGVLRGDLGQTGGERRPLFEVGVADLASEVLNPINFVPLVGDPGLITAPLRAGGRAAAAGGRTALRAGEEAAEAVGRANVGNVLLPAAPDTRALARAGGPEDVSRITRSGEFRIFERIEPEAAVRAAEEGGSEGQILGPRRNFPIHDAETGEPLLAISADRLPVGRKTYEVSIRGLDANGNPLPFGDETFRNTFSTKQLAEVMEQVVEQLDAEAIVGFRLTRGGRAVDLTREQISRVAGRQADALVDPQPEALGATTRAIEDAQRSRSTGTAGGSGPPAIRNRPTADAPFPESSRTALFRPAPSLAAKDDPVVQRIAQAVRDTKPATQESQQALAAGRRQQIARAGGAARGAETFGEVGAAAQRGLGGEIPRPEFESIAPLFSPEDHESLLARIWGRGSVLEFKDSIPGQINFRQINADEAFRKLFHPDHATLPTPSELELLERVFGPELVRAVMSKKRLGERAWNFAMDAWNLPRSLLATGDISATARQAGVLGPGNPKQFKDAFKSQYKAFANEDYALASRERIESDPDFLRFTTKSGQPGGVGTRSDRRLDITSLGQAADRTRREESFMTSFAGRLPIIRNSERAFVTMLNELRFTVMKRMVAAAELASGGPATDAQLDAIAAFINYATGRGSLGKAEAAAPVLNGLGFSPRLAISRFQLPLPILTRAPNVRKKFAQDLATYASALTLLLWLADNSPGDHIDVTANPFSSDFGKMRIGKTRLDFGAGTLQAVRFLTQLFSGVRESIGTRSRSEANRADTVSRFLRTKAHPSLGLIFDVASEEDFLGEEFTLEPERFTELDVRRNPLLRTFTPMIIQDFIEAWKESGPAVAAGVGVLSALGVGASSFSTAEDASQELWGRPITDVWPFQQGEAKDLQARTSDRGPGAFDQADIRHYDAFQDIVQQFNDGTIDKRTAVNRYFSINTFYSGLREGLGAGIFGGDLNEEPVFPVAPSGGTEPQKAALQEYFDSSAPFETPSGFNSAEWNKVLKVLERKWLGEGTLQYVLANTHTRPIPVELIELLPDSTRATIKRSSDARAEFLASQDQEQPEIQRGSEPAESTPAPDATPPLAPQLSLPESAI